MERQQETLLIEFQRKSLDVLESWLLYWPNAAAAAQANPQFQLLSFCLWLNQ